MTTRILVVRPGAVGDTILALPALQHLVAGKAPATLDLVGYPSALRLVACAVPRLPVREVHAIDRARFAPLFSGALSEETATFLASYDLVVAWIHDRDDRLGRELGRLSVAQLRADPYPREGSGVHASRHLIDTLARLGIPGSEELAGPPRIEAPPEALAESDATLRELGLAGQSFVVIHPGSGSARKNWPAENFAGLVARAEAAGYRVLVVEGEADAQPVERLDRFAGRALVRVQQPHLATLAALLSRAAAFVGNDSGVTHLAAATGTPTLAIFGPTDPALWAPRGPRARVLGFDTMVERVWAEVERLLRGSGQRGGNPTKWRGGLPTQTGNKWKT